MLIKTERIKMKIKKIIYLAMIYLALSITGTIVYKKFFRKEKKLPYITENPEKRTIKRIIDTTGKISVAKKVKIGSLVTGTVKKLYADENEWVTKGKLLAEIDTGRDDADVVEAQGTLLRAKADYQYYENHFKRQRPLYLSGQLSKDAFEQIEKDYLNSKGYYKIAQAQLYKAERDFQSTKIVAPRDGVIIYRGVSEGERVTTDLDATILFSIAKDITKMEASLEIDEGDVGQIKDGQNVKFSVDSFPGKVFRTTIKEVSYSPKRKNGDSYYEAVIPVDNSEKLLRPGFSVDAKIFIAKVKDALSITSQAFMISPKVLEEIAKDLNYSFNSVDEEELKRLRKKTQDMLQTVWVVQRNGEAHSFVEKIVTTNITDDIHYEITSGLSEDDDVIVEIEESGYLEEIYKKAFGARF